MVFFILIANGRVYEAWRKNTTHQSDQFEPNLTKRNESSSRV